MAPEEAMRIAYGVGAAPAAPTETAPVHETHAEPEDPLLEMQTELAAVDQQLADYTDGGGALVDADVVALIQRRSDLAANIKAESALRGRENAYTQRQAAEAARARSEQQSQNVQAAAERFPLLRTVGSPLRAEADRLLAMHRGSPFLHEVEAPIAIAELAAFNVAKAQAKANKTSIDAELQKLDRSGSGKPSGKGKPSAQPGQGDEGGWGAAFEAGTPSASPLDEHDRLSRLLYQP